MTTKSTHETNIELFAPVLKEAKGKYIAVLSDTSIDRDGERVGKSALKKIVAEGGYIAALMDHENKILNQVAQWTNMRLTESEGNVALIAEPKFFKSNPNAVIIQNMLNEGAELGISIGAIVKEYEDEKIEGKSMRTFTNLDLLEASFVAIPSNRHGRAMLAMAKSFNKKTGVQTMDNEFTQKDIDLAVEKKESEFKKQLGTKDSEIAKLKKDVEEAKEESDKAESEAKEKVDEAEAKTEEAEKEAEKKVKAAEKSSLEKQKIADEAVEKEKETAEKSFEAGNLPIMQM